MFLQLIECYKRRGYRINVNYSKDKAILFNNFGYRACQFGKIHPWGHYGFNRPNEANDFSGNKLFGNINRAPLPNIGSIVNIWKEIKDHELRFTTPNFLIEEALNFTRNLPKPIILLHTTGNSNSRDKSIPKEMHHSIYNLILKQKYSLIVLDWDQRNGKVNHPNFRHTKRDWGHISLGQLAGLYEVADVLIGIDSGPKHFSMLFDIPAIMVGMSIYPSCVTTPREIDTYLVRDKMKHINIARINQGWNMIEYQGNAPSPQLILEQVNKLVGAKSKKIML